LKLDGNHIYSFIYSLFLGMPSTPRISLILLVWAGRFERPTPCAQGGFRRQYRIVRFQLLPLQADAASLLRQIERYRTWRFSKATNSSTVTYGTEGETVAQLMED
jgi:hypothetical protein